MWPHGWETEPIYEKNSCDMNALKSEQQIQLIKSFNKRCFHSQSKEDEFFYRNFFHNRPLDQTGYFLEMGGHDGLKFSNSYFLEYMFGWKGILIEPDPSQYQKLLVNRPHVIAFNEVVCEKGEVHFMIRGAVSGAAEHFAPEHYKLWHQSSINITLTCQSLTTLLDFVHLRSGVFCYDFFSLDVEGAELSVIKTINFKRFQFKVIVIEEDWADKIKAEAILSILTSHGYLKYPMKDRRNGWYVLQNSTKGCSL